MTDSTRPLPPWLLTELKHPPQTGRHQWLFRTAIKLLRYRDCYPTLELLSGAAKHMGRHVPAREVREAVKDAVRWSPSRSGSLTPSEKLNQAELCWPEPDLVEIDSIVRRGPRHRHLRDLSPEKLSIEQRHTETVIDLLYPGNPLLCCGRESWLFATRRREVWRSHLHRLLMRCSRVSPSTNSIA